MVAIIGCGSLGQRVFLLLRQTYGSNIQFYDDDPEKDGYKGIPVVGSVFSLLASKQEDRKLVIAIGDRAARQRLYEIFKNEDAFIFPQIVHPTADLALEVQLGPGVIVKPRASIGLRTVIGENTIVGAGDTIAHDSEIGRHCNLGPGLTTGGYVKIGDACIVGVGVNIDRGVSVGASSIICSGCTLWKDVPPNSTVKLPNKMRVL